MNTAAPLLIGFAFGWFLQKAGLSRYERIVNVFRFRDLAVLQFLLSALVTAALGIRILQDLGLAGAVPIPTTYVAGNLLGGLVFGVGMALSGFCPGTVAAGAGEGRLDYLVAGGLGLYAGALVYGLGYEQIMPTLSSWAHAGTVTFATMLHVEPWLVILLFFELVVVIFYLVERGGLTGVVAADFTARHPHLRIARATRLAAPPLLPPRGP
jgi:hypothetical protein